MKNSTGLFQNDTWLFENVTQFFPKHPENTIFFFLDFTDFFISLTYNYETNRQCGEHVVNMWDMCGTCGEYVVSTW